LEAEDLPARLVGEEDSEGRIFKSFCSSYCMDKKWWILIIVLIILFLLGLFFYFREEISFSPFVREETQQNPEEGFLGVSCGERGMPQSCPRSREGEVYCLSESGYCKCLCYEGGCSWQGPIICADGYVCVDGDGCRRSAESSSEIGRGIK